MSGSTNHQGATDSPPVWRARGRHLAKRVLSLVGLLEPVASARRRVLGVAGNPDAGLAEDSDVALVDELPLASDDPLEPDVPPGVTVVRTLEEADAMLRHFDEAFAVSDEEARNAFRQYHMVADMQLPDDPFSEEYRDAVRGWYEWLHGQPYAPRNEVTAFDVDEALRVPFPYLTKSTATVGQHLMIVGNAIRSLDLPEHAKVLEFGPGWGNIADALSRMGHEMTVIDIEPNFLELIRRRAEQAGTTITTIQGDFETVGALDEQFDAVLFFECFHHCLDHVALLASLDRVIKPGGRIYLAAEPVNDAFPHPWGLRLDGESLWAIRKNGWLELGFQERYLLEALRRTGWEGRRVSYDEMPFASVYVAERIADRVGSAERAR